MSFNESIIQEAKSKAGYWCCICHKPSVSLEAHHIIPQKDGGSDNLENAAPLCPNCHSDYGDNKEKRKGIKERRDWWYEQVANMYSRNESALIKKISEDVSNINNDKLPELKRTMGEFLKLRIDQITSDTAEVAVSSMLSGATASAFSTRLDDRVHANMRCHRCGTQIGLLIGTNSCPNCKNPL